MRGVKRMNIQGLQKTTLLDYPGQVACTVFLGGCNFRCPFCHNASVVGCRAGEGILEEELFSYLEKRKGILDGVCVTGGEPTLYPELASFLRRIRTLGLKIKLDTNGSRPAVLRALIEEGLCDYVAMDIKNQKKKYAVTAGVSMLDLGAVEESVSLLLEGRVSYEFRTTVVANLHTVEDIAEIGRWIAGAERYALQQFVDSGDLLGPGMYAHEPGVLAEMKKIAETFVKNAEIRGMDGMT